MLPIIFIVELNKVCFQISYIWSFLYVFNGLSSAKGYVYKLKIVSSFMQEKKKKKKLKNQYIDVKKQKQSRYKSSKIRKPPLSWRKLLFWKFFWMIFFFFSFCFLTWVRFWIWNLLICFEVLSTGVKKTSMECSDNMFVWGYVCCCLYIRRIHLLIRRTMTSSKTWRISREARKSGLSFFLHYMPGICLFV